MQRSNIKMFEKNKSTTTVHEIVRKFACLQHVIQRHEKFNKSIVVNLIQDIKGFRVIMIEAAIVKEFKTPEGLKKLTSTFEMLYNI